MRILKILDAIKNTFSKQEKNQLVPIIHKDYCEKHFISDLYCNKSFPFKKNN